MQSPSVITLAVEAGAFIIPTGMGEWTVRDVHSRTVVEGAPSMSEACRRFLEVKEAARG